MGIDDIKLREPYVIIDKSVLKEFNADLFIIFIPEEKINYKIYGLGIYGDVSKVICVRPSQIHF